MPSENQEKNYVKKFKINDLLNDLYLSLTQNKPDDPIEYCIKHFESKLPLERRTSVAVNKTEQPAQDLGRNLFSKLLGGANNNLNSPFVNVPKSDVNETGLLTNALFANFNILVYSIF